MLSLSFLLPLGAIPTVKNHAVAFARTLNPAPHTVRLSRDGNEQEVRTTVATVGDLLRDRGITPGPDDTLEPAVETPLSDGLLITYRAAFPVTLIVRGAPPQQVMTSAANVSTLLAQRAIVIDENDRVLPTLDAPLSPDANVRIARLTQWLARVHERTNPIVEHRLSIALAPNASKVISRGAPFVREKLVRFTRLDNEPRVTKTVIESRVVSKGKPKIVVSGILAYQRYERLAKRAFEGTVRLANSALEMLATAYTANCAGCSGSGLTAIGTRAGRGVVAVDPAVIPLGTRLYIQGYGPAIAGDTGGAIRGNRIDLGFDSAADAMIFGKRPVHVYLLR